MVKFDDLTLVFIFHYILTLYFTDRSTPPPPHSISPQCLVGQDARIFKGPVTFSTINKNKIGQYKQTHIIAGALATLVINSISSMTILSPKIQIKLDSWRRSILFMIVINNEIITCQNHSLQTLILISTCRIIISFVGFSFAWELFS